VLIKEKKERKRDEKTSKYFTSVLAAAPYPEGLKPSIRAATPD